MAAALALAAAPTFAQTYSQTIFFGDSLTDSGAFRPLLVAQNPAAAVLGRFTTNPGLVWAEYLADFYGTRADPALQYRLTGLPPPDAPIGVVTNPGATNFAIGGARTGVPNPTALGPALPVTAQVGRYLATTGGSADPNALYTVWGGANDLFFAAQNPPADAPATIGAAVRSQISAIGTLQAAGARYVLVPSIPDLGLTPEARRQSDAAQAGLTQLARGYNTALYTGLATAGLRVIPLNMFSLFQEVVANPSTFGFTNVTGTACQPQITAQSLTCRPDTYVNPSAPFTYAFADGVHPTLAAHEIIADYAVSMLEAPRRVGVLTNSAAAVGRARADRVATRMIGAPAGAGAGWWADVRADVQRYEHGDLYDGAGPALTGGVDFTSGNLVYGAFAGFGRSGMDWGLRGGSFDQSDATLGAHVAWRSGGGWVDAQLSYSRLDFDIDRTVVLGQSVRTHRASADGDNLAMGVQGGFEFGDGALRHGPVVAALAQRIDIDAFAEDQPTLSTSLSYPEQNFDSLIGSVGWQMSLRASEHFAPYARATIDREFEDAPAEAFAQAQSIPGSTPYAVPGVQFDDSYGTVLLGTRMELFGFDANVGASLTVGQDDGSNTTVFATIGQRF
ncbi:autotransporter domain-containing protein [Cognatilysobacter bugurensis]|uniref:autotransporter domain-containing protein n=1 Tax=Cognatilysobacter bugurensis TaxID=543356 RepID=UPI00167A8EA4|nr:autotransporter domain-containing protein [Lysobacter bugurensis]